MRLKVILILAACIAIGFGLGNAHNSKKAKEITIQAETTLKDTAKKTYKGIKKNAKKIYEELNSED